MMSYSLPPADHPMGYRAATVNRILGDQAPEFWKWMAGQTVAYVEGETIVYEDDFMRWSMGYRKVYD